MDLTTTPRSWSAPAAAWAAASPPRLAAAGIAVIAVAAQRAGLGITFTAVMPRLTALTDLGRPAVQAYAARSGQTAEQYVERFGPPLSPEAAGVALVELASIDAATVAPGYVLTAAGLEELG